MSTPEELPTARIAHAGRAGWTRLLPLLALALAVFLLREAWQQRGPRIAIHVTDGHGLRAGDALRYRGIDVGEVESLELEPGARTVKVGVRLLRSAGELAREGARFWVARPVLGVEGVQGLETAIGARYLAVLPGPEEAESCREFAALEEPPLFEADDPDALEVVLQADNRAGLARGAPVLFRGLAIGSLVSVGLASDASVVEARARIRSDYAELVRGDSRFYRDRGARLSFGLAGLELSVDSLQSLWLGGVGLATPTRAGARAVNGQRFELAPEPEKDWLTWRPALALGRIPAASAPEPPERVWARLTYEPRGWFRRGRAHDGWLVRLGAGVLGPRELLVVPEEVDEDGVTLELGGQRFLLEGPPDWLGDGLARRSLPGLALESLRSGGRPLTKPEDLLLCADPALAPMAVAATHLQADGSGWRLADRLAFDERWHGAVAIARSDGAWVGILLVDEGRGRLAPLPAE